MAKYILSNPSRYRREKGVEFVHPLKGRLDILAEERLIVSASPEDKSIPLYFLPDVKSIPRYYFFMHEFPKVGLNPKAQYNTTPLGVYAYPLTADYLQLLRSQRLPYVGDSQYMTILEATEPEKVLVIDQHPFLPLPYADRAVLSQKPEEFAKYIENLKTLTKANPGAKKKLKSSSSNRVRYYLEGIINLLYDAQHMNLVDSAEHQRILSRLLQYATALYQRNKEELDRHPFTRYMATKSKHLKNLRAVRKEKYAVTPAHLTADLKEQGYTAVYDAGTSAIHGNEPTQMVFLTPTSFKVVETLENEYRGAKADFSTIPALRREYSAEWERLRKQLDKLPANPVEQVISLFDDQKNFHRPDFLRSWTSERIQISLFHRWPSHIEPVTVTWSGHNYTAVGLPVFARYFPLIILIAEAKRQRSFVLPGLLRWYLKGHEDSNFFFSPEFSASIEQEPRSGEYLPEIERLKLSLAEYFYSTLFAPRSLEPKYVLPPNRRLALRKRFKGWMPFFDGGIALAPQLPFFKRVDWFKHKGSLLAYEQRIGNNKEALNQLNAWLKERHSSQ